MGSKGPSPFAGLGGAHKKRSPVLFMHCPHAPDRLRSAMLASHEAALRSGIVRKIFQVAGLGGAHNKKGLRKEGLKKNARGASPVRCRGSTA